MQSSSITISRNFRTSSTSSKRSDISRIVAIFIAWQFVVGFYWMTDGKSQNERRFGESVQDMLCSQEEFGKKIGILIAEIGELEKLDAAGTYPRRLNAKEVLITQKRWRICISCGRWFRKLSGRDCEFQEPTLRRESTVRRENLSGESHGDREEFSTWRTKRWHRSSERILGYSKRLSFILIILNREFNLRAERKIISLFHKIYKIGRNTSEKKYTIRVEIDENPNEFMTRSHMAWYLEKNWKSQNIWSKDKIQ